MKEINYSPLPQPRADGMKYILNEDYVYRSTLFNRTKTSKKGMMSDGATGAFDLGALGFGKWNWLLMVIKCLRMVLPKKWLPIRLNPSFFTHDTICNDPFWDDGYPITNIVASMIVCMINHTHGYWLESYTWFFPTFFFGGKYIKQVNGWIWIKETDGPINV